MIAFVMLLFLKTVFVMFYFFISNDVKGPNLYKYFGRYLKNNHTKI